MKIGKRDKKLVKRDKKENRYFESTSRTDEIKFSLILFTH